MLKLNDDKTELIVHTPNKRQNLCKDVTVTIGNSIVTPKAHAKNLGVIFDQSLSLSMQKHINYVSKTCHYHLRNISRIRRYLTDEASCKTMVQPLVTSRLDHGNVLSHGLPNTTISVLQRVQNTAARIITRMPKRDHITPVLRKLHWLPVEKRLPYKALHGLSPSYVCHLIVPYKPKRSLRSENKSMLHVPKTRTVGYGDRSFIKSSPVLWTFQRQ